MLERFDYSSLGKLMFGGESGAKKSAPVERGVVIARGLGEASVERIGGGKVLRISDSGSLTDEKVREKVEHTKKVWSKLKKYGIPTMTGVEFDESNPRMMVMDDLTRGGLAEVISTPDFGMVKRSDGEERKGKFFEERETIKFELSNAEELSKSLGDLYKQLIDSGFHILPKRDGRASANMFYLVIEKDTHEGRLLLWDLTRVEREHHIDPQRRKELAEDNYRAFARFVEKMNPYLDSQSQLSIASVDSHLMDY